FLTHEGIGADNDAIGDSLSREPLAEEDTAPRETEDIALIGGRLPVLEDLPREVLERRHALHKTAVVRVVDFDRYLAESVTPFRLHHPLLNLTTMLVLLDRLLVQ